MIQEAYVGFEVAKLLKEKGFIESCYGRYSIRSKEFHFDCTKAYNNGSNFMYSAPTHQMAMAWLREKYDLHIIVYPYNANGEKKWCCQVYETFNLLGHEKYIDETLDSYDEAVEAALTYVLKNLI